MKKVMILTLCLVFALSSFAMAANVIISGQAKLWNFLGANGATIQGVEQDYTTQIGGACQTNANFDGTYTLQATVPDAYARYNCRVLGNFSFGASWLNLNMYGKTGPFNVAVGAGTTTITGKNFALY